MKRAAQSRVPVPREAEKRSTAKAAQGQETKTRHPWAPQKQIPANGGEAFASIRRFEAWAAKRRAEWAQQFRSIA